MNQTKNSSLFISFDGMTDPLGQSQVIPYLIGLSNKGWNIIILSCEKEDNFIRLEPKIRELLDRNKISWYSVPYYNKIPLLSSLYTIFCLFRKTSFLYKTFKFNLIHCRSYISALVGLHYKVKYKCKFLFDMRGFWADEKVEGGSWNLKNPVFKSVYSFFKKKEISFFNLADHTISLTEVGKEEIHSWTTIKNQPIPISVIPCCADLELFDYTKIEPVRKNELRNTLGIKAEAFVLNYLGSLGGAYLAEEMLLFFKIVLEKKPDAVFLMNTMTDKEQILKAASGLKINPSKIIVKPAQRSELPLYLSICDLAIYFIKPTFSKIASSPTKQAEILGMGLPIITNKGIGDSDRILGSKKTGFLMDSFSEKDMRAASSEIDQLLKTQKEEIRKVAIDYYSLEIGINNYNLVYRKILA